MVRRGGRPCGLTEWGGQQGLPLFHFSHFNLSRFGQRAVLCPVCDVL